MCDDSADRDSVSLMMVRHHRGLAEHVVAGLDLLECSLIDFRAPNRNAVDDLHSDSFHKIWRAERELNPHDLERQSSALPVGHPRGLVGPSGLNRNPSLRRLCPFQLDEGRLVPHHTESNCDLNVRSVLSCPLNEWGT